MDIGNLRREYHQGSLQRMDLCKDPFDQFELWLNQACDSDIIDPNAMSLATASKDAHPTVRTVLLKYFDRDGFVFFTNLESTKARQIADNSSVSVLFPWLALVRQLIIEGNAEKISTTEALKYFIKRPRGSQLGAWVSKQSSIVSSRAMLEMKFKEIKQKFAHAKIPLPSFWGGYRIRPIQFEFWQGQPNRLHDRFRYTRKSNGLWEIERLAP